MGIIFLRYSWVLTMEAVIRENIAVKRYEFTQTMNKYKHMSVAIDYKQELLDKLNENSRHIDIHVRDLHIFTHPHRESEHVFRLMQNGMWDILFYYEKEWDISFSPYSAIDYLKDYLESLDAENKMPKEIEKMRSMTQKFLLDHYKLETIPNQHDDNLLKQEANQIEFDANYKFSNYEKTPHNDQSRELARVEEALAFDFVNIINRYRSGMMSDEVFHNEIMRIRDIAKINLRFELEEFAEYSSRFPSIIEPIYHLTDKLDIVYLHVYARPAPLTYTTLPTNLFARDNIRQNVALDRYAYARAINEYDEIERANIYKEDMLNAIENIDTNEPFDVDIHGIRLFSSADYEEDEEDDYYYDELDYLFDNQWDRVFNYDRFWDITPAPAAALEHISNYLNTIHTGNIPNEVNEYKIYMNRFIDKHYNLFMEDNHSQKPVTILEKSAHRMTLFGCNEFRGYESKKLETDESKQIAVAKEELAYDFVKVMKKFKAKKIDEREFHEHIVTIRDKARRYMHLNIDFIKQIYRHADKLDIVYTLSM